MEPIQIYHLAPVSRSTRVTWLLAELEPKIQKQFEIKTYDIKKPQEFRNSDEFQKISPLRRFPALVDGKFILTEGIAINNYILRTKAPESSLLPKDLKDLAIYESVNTFMVAHMDGLVAQGLRERFLLPKDQRIPGLLSSLKEEFNRDVVPFLSRRLSTTKYIAADHFTAADINLGTILLLARGLGWVDEHKEIAQYFELLLTSRPEFAKLVSKFMKTSFKIFFIGPVNHNSALSLHIMNTKPLDFVQFRTIMTFLHGEMGHQSPIIATQLPIFRTKLETFKTQSRDLYLEYLPRLLKERDTFNNGFAELASLLEAQDPDGVSLYNTVKQQTFKEALGESITYIPETYYFPPPTFDFLAKFLVYDLAHRSDEMLNKLLAFLAGTVDVEQYLALNLMQRSFKQISQAALLDDRAILQLVRRVIELLQDGVHMRVRLEAVDFFANVFRNENLPLEKVSWTGDDIEVLFDRLLKMISCSREALIPLSNLQELFYDNVTSYSSRLLSTMNDNYEVIRTGFGNQHTVLFDLIQIEKTRKASVEEFEEYDIPHCTKYSNELTDCIDHAAKTLSNAQDFYKSLYDNQPIYSPRQFEDAAVNLASLMTLKPEAELPSELQLYLYAGMKRDLTSHYDDLVRNLNLALNYSTAFFPAKNILDRFQVPPPIINGSIKASIDASSHRLSRAVLFCPTSVALVPSCKLASKDLLAERMRHSLHIGRMDLRPTVELIELFRILGVAEFNSFIDHLMPTLNSITSGTDEDSSIHRHWLTVLKLCHGSITEETATKMLDIFLYSSFNRHLSVICANELALCVNAIPSLSPKDAQTLLKHVTSSFSSTRELFCGWNIEDSYELLRLIGQRGEFTTSQLKDTLKNIPVRACYHVFNALSGFESAVGSEEYLDFVTEFIKQQLRVDNDVQLEFVLRGLNSIFDVHKKKSCVDVFVTKLEQLLNLIAPALADPSHETSLIRNVLRTCPELVTSALERNSSVLRAVELALSPNVSNFAVKDYAKQISSALNLHQK